MLGDHATPQRRRAISPQVHALRQAREIAAPFQVRIAPWQKQLAYLRTARRFRADDNTDGQAAELLPLVVAAGVELEAALVEVSDEAVTGHSAIASVRAFLVRLREELEDLETG